MSDPANAPASGPQLEDHEYDGIREYDNPTPGWWWLLFWLTFVYGVGYFLWYEVADKNAGIYDEYQAHVEQDIALSLAKLGKLEADPSTVLELMGQDDALLLGQTIFTTNCASCHAKDGAGLVGPNLTDESYKNLTDLSGLIDVVENGAANGAMPAWKNRLLGNDLVLVTAYTAALRGKNLSGKAAEGQAIAPWAVAQSAVDVQTGQETVPEPEDAAVPDQQEPPGE